MLWALGAAVRIAGFAIPWKLASAEGAASTNALLLLAFAALHFMLYVFYPRLKANLFYALFALCMAGIAYSPVRGAILQSLTAAMIMFGLFKISLILMAPFGLRFIYALYRPKPPRQFWFFVAGGIILLFFSGMFPIGVIYAYVGLFLLEMVRVIAVLVARKEKDARILLAGGISLFVLTGMQMLTDAGVIRFLDVADQYHLYGMMAFAFSVSVTLARQFARTSFRLEKRLAEVQTLSQKTLEQERRAKEQEMSQKLLEAELEHRARQLEEARKLEQALRDLEATNLTLRETQAQLVQSEKMASLGMLVAGVAHEINTPVGAISSMYDTSRRGLEKLRQTLEQDFPEEYAKNRKVKGALQAIDDANKVIKSGSERVSNIVKRLRSFARLDEADLKEANIHDGLEDTLTVIHHEIKGNIEVTRDYGDVPPFACYPGQLNQVFLNILINAKQAIGDKEGEIRIGTFKKDETVFIEISDDGAGIEPENLAKLFDPGYTTKGVGVGTGLGLSICYQIIEMHEGRIAVESEPGRGTTFRIEIPSDLERRLKEKRA